MSAPDVLAALDRQLRNRAERANRYSKSAVKAAAKSGEPQITADRMAAYENLLLSELREARAAVAELIEAAEWKLMDGTAAQRCGHSYCCNCANEKLRTALARVQGGQP